MTGLIIDPTPERTASPCGAPLAAGRRADEAVRGPLRRPGRCTRAGGMGPGTECRSGRLLAVSSQELGMSLRTWRRRLRLVKAIEMLGGGLGVTQTAMEIGNGSTSAFVYAFRSELGCSPQVYVRGRVPSWSGHRT